MREEEGTTKKEAVNAEGMMKIVARFRVKWFMVFRNYTNEEEDVQNSLPHVIIFF